MSMASFVRQTWFVSHCVMFPKIFVQISVKVSYKFADFYMNVQHRHACTLYFKRFPYRVEVSRPSCSNFSTKLRMVA